MKTRVFACCILVGLWLVLLFIKFKILPKTAIINQSTSFRIPLKIDQKRYVISHVVPKYQETFQNLINSGLLDSSKFIFARSNSKYGQKDNQQTPDGNSSSTELSTLELCVDTGSANVSGDSSTEKKEEKVYPFVSIEEIIRNGSVIRPELFPPPPVYSIRYEWGNTTCNNVQGTITSSAKDVLNRKLIIPARLFLLFVLC